MPMSNEGQPKGPFDNAQQPEAWSLIGVFHNLQVSRPIGNEYMVVVPPIDPKLGLVREEPGFKKYINSFSNQFEQKITPSVLIAHKNTSPTVESVVAFRNALAISAITKAWMRYLAYNAQNVYFKYSEYFDLYPHLLSKDPTLVVVRSPSVLGVDEVRLFQGQSSPGIAVGHAEADFVDPYLLSGLLSRWVDHFIKSTKSVDAMNIALFRSLQMAFRACAMPYQNRSTHDDYGAQLALWVSACEILVWPNSGHASLSSVLDVLEKIRHLGRRLRGRRYSIKLKNVLKKVPLPQRLYVQMYQARNDYLHGNPVGYKTILPFGKRDRHPLTCYAPLVYRFLLFEMLDLWGTQQGEENVDAVLTCHAYESAVNTASIPISNRKVLA
jgi:hypothetical protein